MFLLDGNNVSFWAQLLDTLRHADTWLFLKINNDWTNPFLDGNYPWWREASTWIPLYFFLLFLAFYNFGIKVFPWVVFFALTAVLSDQISSGILKDWVNRPRPCNDDVLMSQVRLLLNRCPGSGSFTSSHATNHFAAACFIYYTMKPYFKNWVTCFLYGLPPSVTGRCMWAYITRSILFAAQYSAVALAVLPHLFLTGVLVCRH